MVLNMVLKVVLNLILNTISCKNVCSQGNSRNSRERKKEKNIAQLHSDCLRLNILFDCFSYEEMKNKMAANEEKLSIAVQKYPAKKHT